MSDNLAKLGFKGHDGKAKPGNLDENGNLKVKISGNNLDESDNIKVADSNVSQQIVGLSQSIASLQTQISNLANIIGQIKGYDGSAWKNLKVDSQGRPVLASDVTVNAEGLVVDVGELDITDRPERELGKVQLSGNMVELASSVEVSIEAGALRTITISGGFNEYRIACAGSSGNRADLLEIPNVHFRMLPYGVCPNLTWAELSDLGAVKHIRLSLPNAYMYVTGIKGVAYGAQDVQIILKNTHTAAVVFAYTVCGVSS